MAPLSTISLSEFRELMFKKNVPVADLLDRNGKPLINSITFWRRKKLLLFIDEGKWLKINFMQLIWLRILDDLRQFGFPVEKMQKVCEYFFIDSHNDDLPEKNLQHNRELLDRKIKLGTASHEDQELYQRIGENLQSEVVLMIFKFDVNYLSNFIATAISFGEGHIFIFFDGSVNEYIGNTYVGHREENKDMSTPFIRLSVSYYLKEFIQDKELTEHFMPLIINDDEKKVIREMRDKNIKQLIIHLNDSETRIESTKTGVISKEQTQMIKEVLGLKNYERITIDTIDEKTLSFKKTRKKV